MFRYGTVHDWWEVSRHYNAIQYRRTDGPRKCVLKSLGYAHVLGQIRARKPRRVLEFGHGPTSPLFDVLGEDVELWGLDKVSQIDGWDPAAWESFRQQHPKARFEIGYLGPGQSSLPSDYFDLVCSVSVVEHIPTKQLDGVFAEIRRLLRPGGAVVNSTDIYFGQPLQPLFDAHVRNGFRWAEDFCVASPRLDPSVVMMEDPRTVMEDYLQYLPLDQRRWPGNFLSILSAATKPADISGTP